MKTNLTVRNLIGAFVGGVAGILTCYYVSLAFMPLGCLIGVVLGFWHDKIIADYSRNLIAIRHFLSACRNQLIVWMNRTVGYIKMSAEHLRRLGSMIPKDLGLSRDLIRGFVWFVSLPLLFFAWLRRHPMNRADTITVLTVPIIILALWKFGYFSLALPGNNSIMEQKNAPAWLQFVGIGLFISTLFVVIGPVLLMAMRSDGDMSGFYRQYSRYSRYGAVGWMVYEIKNTVMMFAYAFTLTELVLGGLFIFVALIFITVAILLFVVAPARVFLRCVQLPGHWFCFGITLITTLITWLCLRDHIVNPAVAWTLAIGNGIVAAGATESLRRAYELLVLKWCWLHELTHMRGLFGEHDDIINFLGRTLGKPMIRMIVSVWRMIQSRLPNIRINPDSFWLPM